MKSTEEVLAFDWGMDIVGVLDVSTGSYSPYRGKRMADGAERIFACEGIIVSFNGTNFDLPKLTELLGSDERNAAPVGEHVDMQIEASRERWLPYLGTSPIIGVDLMEYYIYFFGDPLPEASNDIKGEYERDNWRDCRMAADLWIRICREQNGSADGKKVDTVVSGAVET